MIPPDIETPGGMFARSALYGALRLPLGPVARLGAEMIRNDRGAPLDGQTQRLLGLMELQGGAAPEKMSLRDARLTYDRANRLFDFAREELLIVEDHRVPTEAGGIDVRVYRPKVGVLPGCVFYHGGGFTIGSVEGYDHFCRWFARRTETVVVSVEYRLAPEAPFPAGVEDALSAYRWVRENAGTLGLQKDRIAVAGDSAGATLAAVVTQEEILASGEAPYHRLLIYPKTDQGPGYPSREHFKRGFLLTGELMAWFTRCYLPDGCDPEDPRVSPICFERLREFGTTTVVTAGFDPLRDEGEAYVRRLKEAGVAVSHFQFDRLIHGYLMMGGVVDAARRANEELAAEFRDLMNRRED